MHAIDNGTPLAELVRVRQQATRSINIERDLGQNGLAESYVLTAQGRQSLARIIEGSNAAGSIRAWTLTGPYGSGKSYFSLFLMNLLSLWQPAHDFAVNQLRRVDPVLAEKVSGVAGLDRSAGFLPVAISGHRSAIQTCIRHGLRAALESHVEYRAVRELLQRTTLWSNESGSRGIIEIIEQLQGMIASHAVDFSGIILVFDEMGKTLEFSAAHPAESDLFLLQEMAELANRSQTAPVIVVGILHQAFERYVGHADGVTQREWAKIQGRFEDIAFQEPPNQQLWLFASALEYTRKQDAIEAAWPNAKRDADYAAEHNLYPPTLRQSDFLALCERTVPFHPSAMVALPYLFRRLAQNERSMFAYLTSLEPRGFQEFLAQRNAPDQVRLADLFDYVSANFQGRLYSSLRARALTETLDKIESNSRLDPIEADTLKTIGMLSWLAEVGPFQVTLDNIVFAVHSHDRAAEDVRAVLQRLQRSSTIVFRRFNQTFAIWQGSDVDIDERVEEARQRQLAGFSTAQAAQRYVPPQPIVARRHSFETGFTRYFTVRYVDSSALHTIPLDQGDGASGTVLLCLSASPTEVEAAIHWAQREQFVERADLVVGVLMRTPRLAEILIELHCLNWVHDNTPELRDDAVARRELRTRLNDLETLVRNELDSTLRIQRQPDSTESRWFHCGKDVGDRARRGLSVLLSFVCEHLYVDSPTIRNEILNRSQLSSQGAAARRTLIEGMLLRSDQPLLGIQGYPPERSMYESLLKSGGLHVNGGARWRIAAPEADADPLHLLPVWSAIRDYVFVQPPRPRSVQELFRMLAQPPYGLTDGVAPVLLCAFLIVHAHETTMYTEGTLLPSPDIADWEVLLRRPELYAVAGCRVVGARLVVIERLARGLQTRPAAMPVVRELIRQIKTLPDHVLRTQRLSPSTLAVRKALEQARSPESLLFHELPVALGVEPFAETEEGDPTYIEGFFQRLNAALQELARVMPNLLAEARDQLLISCGMPGGEESWRQFVALAAELAPKVNQPALSPLLTRAGNSSDARTALESTVAYVVNRPPRSWSDSDREQFAAKARTFGELFQRERNGRATLTALTETQRSHSRRLTESIRRTLQHELETDALAVRAALQSLLDELQQETDAHHRNGATTHD